MHDTAFAIGSRFLAVYAADEPKTIVELGSYNINGSLRTACPAASTYLGLDLEHGPDVDVLVKVNEPLPLRSGFADLVLSSSQMEHDPMFWRTFLELVRITREGGFIYMSAPSNGKYHTFPHDCWRFYPDAGKALAAWGRASGFAVALVESFTAERSDDPWNDFVAVFQIGAVVDSPAKPFLSDMFACSNVWRLGSDVLVKARDSTEDGVIADRQRVALARLQTQLTEVTSAHDAAQRDLASAREQVVRLEAECAHLGQLRAPEPASPDANAPAPLASAELAVTGQVAAEAVELAR